MSNKKEIEKLAKEIKQIKAQLSKESANGNVFSEMIIALFPGLKVNSLRTGLDSVLVEFNVKGFSKVVAYIQGFDKGSLIVTACKQNPEYGQHCELLEVKLHNETTSSAAKKISMFLNNL